MATPHCFVFPSDTSSVKEPVLPEQIEKLNRQNTEHSHDKEEAESERGADRECEERGKEDTTELILNEPDTSAAQSEETKKVTEKEGEDKDGVIFEESESEKEREDSKVADDEEKKNYEEEAPVSSEAETCPSVVADICKASPPKEERYYQLFIDVRF